MSEQRIDIQKTYRTRDDRTVKDITVLKVDGNDRWLKGMVGGGFGWCTWTLAGSYYTDGTPRAPHDLDLVEVR